VTGRRERRRRKLLDVLKERKGYSHLKEEALDRTMWRARFGRGCGTVVRQTAKRINEWMNDVSARALTPYPGDLNRCRSCIAASEDGLKEGPKHVRQK
jgi:hypothetical protein